MSGPASRGVWIYLVLYRSAWLARTFHVCSLHLHPQMLEYECNVCNRWNRSNRGLVLPVQTIPSSISGGPQFVQHLFLSVTYNNLSGNVSV